MNIMRKILSSSGSQGDTEESNSNPEVSSTSDSVSNPRDSVPGPSFRSHVPPSAPHQIDVLALTHLKKLYAEFHTPAHPLTESEKEERLYNMLPLFCKVFDGGPAAAEKTRTEFPDAKNFTKVCSRLLVTEVRRRASDQSTAEAANAIAGFMQVGNAGVEVSSSRGWALLTTLNVLCLPAAEDICEVMTTASVPSTLVKCLYLFFDLQHPGEDSAQQEADFTCREKRILLQKLLLQLLLRLCSHVPAVEELARKDDLTLLFSAVTSACPEHNVMWRKASADILLTISRHSLSQPVISYLHSRWKFVY